MGSFSSSIFIFWIFAVLFWIAAIAFVSLDKDCKGYRWLWLIGTALTGPVCLIFYWFFGRERQ